MPTSTSSFASIGGGPSGQSGACKLGIALALKIFDAGTEEVLRQHHLLTRDSRMKERKKYGLARRPTRHPVLEALIARRHDELDTSSLPARKFRLDRVRFYCAVHLPLHLRRALRRSGRARQPPMIIGVKQKTGISSEASPIVQRKGPSWTSSSSVGG